MQQIPQCWCDEGEVQPDGNHWKKSLTFLNPRKDRSNTSILESRGKEEGMAGARTLRKDTSSGQGHPHTEVRMVPLLQVLLKGCQEPLLSCRNAPMSGTNYSPGPGISTLQNQADFKDQERDPFLLKLSPAAPDLPWAWGGAAAGQQWGHGGRSPHPHPAALG